jgi:hypothetical protein
LAVWPIRGMEGSFHVSLVTVKRSKTAIADLLDD